MHTAYGYWGSHLLLVSRPGRERSYIESYSGSTHQEEEVDDDHDADDDEGAASVGEALMRGRRQYGQLALFSNQGRTQSL